MAKANHIYIGPSIPPLGLHRNALYLSAEPPAALALIAGKKPAVLSLFIPTAALAEAKKRLATPGSLEHAANREMLAVAKTTPR
jgi:hypothetical protein